MAEIVKISIKGASGFCCYDDAYEDKLVITQTSISYDYCPMVESSANPHRKWNYRTDSPVFQKLFSEVVELVKKTIPVPMNEDMWVTDVGGIQFTITYSDKTKLKEIYFVTGDEFLELFRAIKKLVPNTEYTPAVLLTSDDYEDD